MKRVLKLLGGLLAIVVLAVAGLVAAMVLTAAKPARPVGVQQVLAPDPGHPSIPVTLFYPTEAKPRLTWLGLSFVQVAPSAPVAPGVHPLVVISHGTGGAPTGHLDTALALAEAGYVVAAPVHPGDNFQDQSAVGTGRWIPDRARQVARVNDYLLGGWSERARLDPQRVGLFGFSAGGTTALVAVGGTPDLARIAPHCRTTPEFACRLMQSDLPAPAADAWIHDPRIGAAVVASPGLGFAFAPDGLAAVKAPVQLWAGAADTSVPAATNADVVGRLLPQAEVHTVKGAEHFSFLTPCGAAAVLLPRTLCADPKGFDRAAFHRQFNAEVVRFFDRELARPEASGDASAAGS